VHSRFEQKNSTKHAAYSVQRVCQARIMWVCSVGHGAYIIQHEVWSMQRTVLGVQHAACDMKHKVCSFGVRESEQFC